MTSGHVSPKTIGGQEVLSAEPDRAMMRELIVGSAALGLPVEAVRRAMEVDDGFASFVQAAGRLVTAGRDYDGTHDSPSLLERAERLLAEHGGTRLDRRVSNRSGADDQ